VKTAWVIRHLSPVLIGVVCFGQIEQSGFLRFRCRMGHAFTDQHLGVQQRQAVETALWEALRALKRKRLALSTNGRPREDFTSRAPGTPVPRARV
jgi:hypothetical protein